MLSDGEIRRAMEKGEIAIFGNDDLGIHIGSSSVDLHLHNGTKILQRGDAISVIDAEMDKMFVDYDGWDEITIYPGEFYIMSTVERIRFANDIVGFVQGRSSLARLGIQVHCAGFADAGFDGTITLEVTNLTHRPIIIPKNTRICQMVFARTGKPAEVPYGENKKSKYQGQRGPTLTRINKDYGEK